MRFGSNSELGKSYVEYYPILTGKEFSLKLEYKMHTSCASCLMYDSEMWPLKVEYEVKLDRIHTSILRCMVLHGNTDENMLRLENCCDFSQPLC